MYHGSGTTDLSGVLEQCPHDHTSSGLPGVAGRLLNDVSRPQGRILAHSYSLRFQEWLEFLMGHQAYHLKNLPFSSLDLYQVSTGSCDPAMSFESSCLVIS